MKCFYHGVDPDGWCSKEIVKSMYPNTKDTDFIPVDYTKSIDFSVVRKYEHVWIVDYSLSNKKDIESIIELYNTKTKNIFWVDHHQNSVDFDKEHPEIKISGIRFVDNKYSAALLVWYFREKSFDTIAYKDFKYIDMSILNNLIFSLDDVNNDVDLISKAPLSVKYISDHDNFTYKYSNTGAFNLGIRYWYEKGEYKHLFTDETYLIDEVIRIGNLLLDNQNMINERNKCKAFEIYIGNKLCIAMNRQGNSSIFCELYDMYDAVMPYYFDGECWTYSLYTNLNRETHLDCGKIATMLGGGGREGAAGFRSNELLIKEDLDGNFYLDLQIQY